jgi:hypothetical protein
MAPSFVSTSSSTTTTPKGNLANGIGNVTSVTTRNHGVGVSINGWGHVLTFNLVVEFFQKLQRRKGFQQKNYKVCKSLNVSHMKAYIKHMFKLNN